MWFFTRKRIHESMAFAAVLAAAISLHAIWIANLLIIRYSAVAKWFTLAPELGAVTGLYLLGAVVFFLSFGTITIFYHEKDCSHHRTSIFIFLIISLLIYLFATCPVISGV